MRIRRIPQNDGLLYNLGGGKDREHPDLIVSLARARTPTYKRLIHGGNLELELVFRIVARILGCSNWMESNLRSPMKLSPFFSDFFIFTEMVTGNSGVLESRLNHWTRTSALCPLIVYRYIFEADSGFALLCPTAELSNISG